VKWPAPAPSTGERVLLLACAALTVYFTLPLLRTGNQLGVEDWDVMLFYHASVIKSVVEYGALPFWNPWYCGGNVLWQNPQVALLSPVYPLSLAVPLPLAMKLNIVLHYLAGFLGMHVLLTRGFKISYLPGVLFLSCLFTLAGGEVFHLAVGHATFLPYFYLPWVLFFFLLAIRSGQLRYGVITAAIIAVAVYNGGIHISFMTGVALAWFSFVASLLRRDWRPAALLAVVGALAFLLAAPKLLPVAAFVGDPRTVDTRNVVSGADTMGRDMLLHALLDPYQYRRLRFEGQNYGWHEYGNYVGTLGVLLIVASFIWIMVRTPSRRENWQGASLALTTLLLLLLALGEFGSYAPYVLLHRLPIVSQFRLPSRYVLVFVLFATAMIASAWRTFALDRPNDASRFAGIVLILSSCALAYWNHIQFEGVFSLAPLQSSFHWLSRPGEPVVDQVSEGLIPSHSPMLLAMMENRAILRCYEPLQLPGGIDATRPVVFPDTHARIADVVFAPGRIQFRAQSQGEAGRVFLNERYVKGWHSSAGEFTLDPQTGLAYVTVPPGETGRFTFWFTPPGLVAGVVLLAVGLALSVLIWRRSLGPARGVSPA
jgi:hypothetical protein